MDWTRLTDWLSAPSRARYGVGRLSPVSWTASTAWTPTSRPRASVERIETLELDEPQSYRHRLATRQAKRASRASERGPVVVVQGGHPRWAC